MINKIKTVLVKQLNIICSENAEACNLSDDELHR